MGGLTNAFTYKGFELSFLATFSYGGLFYDGNYQGIMHRGSAGTAWSSDILNRWQKPGDVTVVPRLQYAIGGQDGASTRWLMDGSYLNLKNVTLSYTVPGRIANKAHLGGAIMLICLPRRRVWIPSVPLMVRLMQPIPRTEPSLLD
jgi:hypothetical protein